MQNSVLTNFFLGMCISIQIKVSCSDVFSTDNINFVHIDGFCFFDTFNLNFVLVYFTNSSQYYPTVAGLVSKAEGSVYCGVVITNNGSIKVIITVTVKLGFYTENIDLIVAKVRAGILLCKEFLEGKLVEITYFVDVSCSIIVSGVLGSCNFERNIGIIVNLNGNVSGKLGCLVGNLNGYLFCTDSTFESLDVACNECKLMILTYSKVGVCFKLNNGSADAHCLNIGSSKFFVIVLERNYNKVCGGVCIIVVNDERTGGVLAVGYNFLCRVTTADVNGCACKLNNGYSKGFCYRVGSIVCCYGSCGKYNGISVKGFGGKESNCTVGINNNTCNVCSPLNCFVNRTGNALGTCKVMCIQCEVNAVSDCVKCDITSGCRCGNNVTGCRYCKVGYRVEVKEIGALYCFAVAVLNLVTVNGVGCTANLNNCIVGYCTCSKYVFQIGYIVIFNVNLNNDVAKRYQGALCNLYALGNFDYATLCNLNKVEQVGDFCIGCVVNGVVEVVVGCSRGCCRNVNEVDFLVFIIVGVDERTLIGHNSGLADSCKNCISQSLVVVLVRVLESFEIGDCLLVICLGLFAHLLDNIKELCNIVGALIICDFIEQVEAVNQTGRCISKGSCNFISACVHCRLRSLFENLLVGKKLDFILFSIVPVVVAVLCALGVELACEICIARKCCPEIGLRLDFFALGFVNAELCIHRCRDLCVGTDVGLFNNATEGWNHNCREDSNYRNYDNKLYNGKCSAFVVTYHLCFSFFLQKIFACAFVWQGTYEFLHIIS